MLTWTEQRPSKPGWYWMLYPAEAPGIPIVTQIVIDTSGSPPALCVLVPAAKPKAKGMVYALQNVDAMWAGPLELPLVSPVAAL